jgi:Disulphide bond corrector protein DsbC
VTSVGHETPVSALSRPRGTRLMAAIAPAIAGLILLQQAAWAQAPVNDPPPAATVSWTVLSQTVTKGARSTLTLRGQIVPGWHVYGLKQLPNGPTPLLVTVADNAVAKADGAPTGSAPTKFHDPDFGLETQFYASDFTLTVPVRLKPDAGAGQQQIPIDVRFQTCNGRICQPPKTVRLLAPVDLQAG